MCSTYLLYTPASRYLAVNRILFHLLPSVPLPHHLRRALCWSRLVDLFKHTRS